MNGLDSSQFGEYTVLSDLFVRLSMTASNKSKLCEFGAHDGSSNSNIRGFGIQGWTCVFIEGNNTLFEQMAKSVSELPDAIAIQAMVGWDLGATLKDVLDARGITAGEVEFVSIDIDGDDDLVFEHMGFRPKVVMVEFNPSFGTDSIYRNPRGRNIGNSLLQVIRTGADLGYFPYAVTAINVILVLNEFRTLVPEFVIPTEIHAALVDSRRFALGYDGTIVKYLPSGKDLTSEVYSEYGGGIMLQPLPKFLRTFEKRRKVRRIYSVGMLVLTRPFAIRSLLTEWKRSRLKVTHNN